MARKKSLVLNLGALSPVSSVGKGHHVLVNPAGVLLFEFNRKTFALANGDLHFVGYLQILVSFNLLR